MFKQFIKPKINEVAFIQLEDISAQGRARLLDMAFSRLMLGLYTMPIISATFAWYYQLNSESHRVAIWSFCYFCAGIIGYFINKTYNKDKQNLDADAILKNWLPRIQTIVAIHSFGLMLLLPMVSYTATLEFKYLFILTLTAIMSTNATHQSPMLSIFNRLLFFGWHGTVLLMPWSFHDHWQFIMPLSIIYSFAISRHALSTHRFFVRMIWLEEEGSRLAASFKAAKESVETALNDKNQFLTTASHDLRQPVHAMSFLIESIAHRNHDSSLEPALKDLKQSVRSVTQMFNSLLDLSKIESGKVELKTGHVYLDPLIQEIAMVFNEEARAKNLEIRMHLSNGNAVIRTDGTLLRQSIMNLMHNALRYTKQGGILIAVRKHSESWQIDIWDTGIGVANDDQDHIYSPFFRNEHAWRIDSAGHGLGLAVVARCCEIMGAQYGFRSRLNRGSHFWLRLPALKEHLQSFQVINNPYQVDSQQHKSQLSGTCLIVDDDPQVTSAWESLLTSWGLQVKCVASGAEALALLSTTFQPQAIFCDQRLRAGESGFDILCALLEHYPEAHGAMISGEFNSVELQQAESEGYLVLHKPLEPDQLHTVLTRWLNVLLR
ncbi:hybrid sensor histidine kinase/response regulator [Methylotenera sp.]|uniref:hybrid sensor histidine kinase/response regulator n=1 Tax=Methylotenera sp. TaxID=2051956 RepID=UPI00271A3318|nr:hybrid sensor histidine kinase/response regulator [Methylotenera sp.]MDO9205090.1 hybrid sensor histidine kinase/response regulator [Methylotenera sp.]MDP2070255.1 hybrid sensor histidine kinase/response regulator [Methylotenera sp.]MDP3007425.1 hybrid sensor histidine kinase/response regulator [Methylotenera sp.]MDP3307228.1 hybrid sensor histidine kinase/response regulator [Methylotenera sp.]